MGLLSSITGGLLGTSKGTTTTTQNSQPWAAVQPYMRDVFSRGQSLYNQNFTSPYTTQAQTGIADRAMDGSPLVNQAQNQALSTIRGDYLDPYSNPYFGGALNQTLGDVQSRINSQFRGDNFGSSAHQEWLGRGLTNAAMPMLSQFYNTERGNQMNAMGMAPGLANQDYTDLDRLLGVGQMQEDDPWKDLMRYQGAISGFGNLGGTTTTEQPYFQNNTANTLGTLTNAALLGKIFKVF